MDLLTEVCKIMINTNYTNLSDIKEYWFQNIAPHYFDFDNVNNYQAGLFGYVNEVMGEATEDVFHAINTVRREFYPHTAKFESSLFKMAALQEVPLPLTTPATANIFLLLNQREILERSTFSNGLFTFVLDDSMMILADNIPFVIEYPIIILAKQKTNDGEFSFNTHYDLSVMNSLSNAIDKYIPNAQIQNGGSRYLMLSINARQCTLLQKTEMITKDPNIYTITKDFPFDGNLANFEIFYQESETSEEIQLKKVPLNGNPATSPFVYYEIVNSNIIRITIKKNIYFLPKFNSFLHIRIYTTLGSKGEFPECLSDLVCQMQSIRYVNNNTMMITGQVNGASSGAKDKLSLEEFSLAVRRAYITNNTITTASDLQSYFNSVSDMIGNTGVSQSKLLFKKKRDDVLWRIYGSYALFKDENGNIIPTNTIPIKIAPILAPEDTIYYIKPGEVFQYKDYLVEDTLEDRICDISDLVITDVLNDDIDTNGNLFTSPYLISINIQNSLIGFYLNSLAVKRSLVYTYMNDNSYNQFIVFSASIERNALLGQNFYSITMNIKSASTIDPELICKVNDSTDIENQIRAKDSGYIKAVIYKGERIYAIVVYDNGSLEEIPINTYTNKDKNFTREIGYTLKYEVGDHFLKDNVLAVKKVEDSGRLTCLIDFEPLLISNQHYIPMYIEEYNKDTDSFVLRGYIGTDDKITANNRIVITNGIYDDDGVQNTNLSMPYKDLSGVFYIFYKDETTNIPHTMTNFKMVESHTLTNITSFSTAIDGPFNLIQQIDYVRSVVDFVPYDGKDMKPETELNSFLTFDSNTLNIKDSKGEIIAIYNEEDDVFYSTIVENTVVAIPKEIDHDNGIISSIEFSLIEVPVSIPEKPAFSITVDEIPVVSAIWSKISNNFKFFINKIAKIYSILQDEYLLLENNFGIDLKFYNTYGKASNFKVGLGKERVILDRVNSSLRFGAYFTSVGNLETRLMELKYYIKEYIESINYNATAGQSVYIHNLTADCMKNIDGLGYMEWYGINIYDHGVQTIEAMSDLEIQEYYSSSYIPEFLNINSIVSANGSMIPDISITVLNDNVNGA